MSQSKPGILIFDRQLMEERAYWLDKLRDVPEPSSLPLDHPRRPGAEQDIGVHTFALPEPIQRQLADLTGSSPFLLYTVLLAALKLCLHKMSGTTTLIVGSPARRQADSPDHTNVVAIRSETTPELTFRAFLLQLRQTLLDAYAHQRYPFERLVRDLGCASNAERCPLFDVALRLEGLHGDLPPLATDLTLTFSQPPAGLSARIAYASRLFLPQTVACFAGHYNQVLEQVLANKDITIGALTLVDTAERERLLGAWNVTDVDYPREFCLARLFEAQVERSPQAPALSFESTTLNYQELNQRANRLAHHLRALGVGPDARVGLCSECSLELIVGVLGILKAGGAYVPLDPCYPRERIAWLMEDTRATVLLTQEKLLPRLPSLGAAVVCLDQDQPYGVDNPTPVAGPANLAYVIYTSGSTGKPKGVMAEHRNVVNLVYSLQERVYRRYAETLRVTLISPCIFDASVPQIFGALCLGHELVVVPEEKRLDGAGLLAFYRDHRIDIADGTPNLLRLLTAHLGQATLPVLQFLIGGEALQAGMLRDFFERCGARPPLVTNVYGPAECCGESTAFDIDPETLAPDASVPIGTPLPNERVLILDAALQLQPVGAPGEICIAGDGVTRGYLGQDSLTRERFVDNPFAPGTPLYRSGDRGRYRDDGNLEYLGRMDQQLKIRGCRVEPAEIEQALRGFNKEMSSKLIRQPAPAKTAASAPAGQCRRCLLSAQYPGISFDADGVCNVCRRFDGYRQPALAYFQTPADFERLAAQAQAANLGSSYDCLLLFSGGKDSSYVLHRLVEQGLRVLAFTFDNGFISQAAFANIERTTARLGVKSIITRLDNMNEIFVESLNHDHTVCSGCFKALTTLSTRIAVEERINMVVTGLSRGQIVETKLDGLFREGLFEIAEVEEKLLLFRKMYHVNEDRIAKLLDIDLRATPFDAIHWVDYFRYDATPVGDIRAYLSARDSYWSEPKDTGFCSSNCRINDIGICVHRDQRGYHNYEAPLSWDVRMGLVERAEAAAQLKYDFPAARVNKTLNHIGYFNKRITDARVVAKTDGQGNAVLCAYFIANQNINASELREYLAEKLPDFMIPSHFIRLKAFPLTVNGKVDTRALPDPGRPELEGEFRAPATDLEKRLARIWAEALGHERVGVHDNFFDLGGHSLLMTQVHGKIRDAFKADLSIVDLFSYPTISALADHLSHHSSADAERIERAEERSRRQQAALARQREVMLQVRAEPR